MTGTVVAGSWTSGKRAVVVFAALLVVLATFAWRADLAEAQTTDPTLTVSTQGGGRVTGPGIDCGNGGVDCTESYPVTFVRVCEIDPETGRPICTNEPTYQDVTLTTSTASGFQFQGWGGACTGAQGACTLTMDADKSASAAFADVESPTVGANNATVTVDEGQTATNSGSYADNAGGTVVITASRGTVTKAGTNNGTWSWSQATDDGPSLGGPVTISARDSSGNLSTTTFNLTVNNLAPTATLNAPQTSYANKTFVISMTDPSDPSGADRNGLTYAFDCGSGYGSFASARFVSCQSGAGPSRTVRGKVRDKDGGETEYTRTVTVNAAPQSHPNAKIAFISFRDANNQEIYTMSHADGSWLRRLTHTGAQEANVAYSPDGRRISYDRDGEIYVMNANGTGQINLTTSPATDTLPAFSPDGSKIAFQSGTGDNGEIFVMNADGTGQARLTSNTSADTDPAYAPNGSQVAFTSNRDGNDEIYVINADGSSPTNVTNNPAADLDPTYSPFDGARIAFQTSRTGNDEIFAMNLGLGATNLTNDPATDVQPSYAPFSFQMAFSSTRDGGNWEIYKMDDFSGANPTRLTNDPALDVDPSWGGANDTLPPQTIITSGPPNAGFSNSASATFGFVSGSAENSPAFECQLDGGAFEPCASTRTYNNLVAGEHTFRVQAIDASGNVDPTPETRTWTVDLTAPTVTGTAPSDGTLGVLEGTSATVTFSEAINTGTSNNTTFTLAKQGASSTIAATYGYDAATNTATLNPDGDLDSLATYTVTVKGGTGGIRDRAGNPLLQDRTWSFRTGDTRNPNVSLTSPADGATVGDRVQLRADATDNGVVERVEFVVNGSVVHSDLTAPYEFTWSADGVTNGDTVRISARAVDTASNQSTSAVHTVTVDNTAPETILAPSGPSGTVNTTSASFSFSSEVGATFQCSLDGAGFAACSPPKGYSALASGPHIFSVRAVDGAGNTGPAAKRTWTVDATRPTVKSVSPAHLAGNVAPTANVTAVFSEAMNAATINRTTFKLVRRGTTAPVAAVVSYNAATRTATLNPSRNLLARTTYTATVTTGAKDAAGNPLDQSPATAGNQPRSWSFTVRR